MILKIKSLRKKWFLKSNQNPFLKIALTFYSSGYEALKGMYAYTPTNRHPYDLEK